MKDIERGQDEMTSSKKIEIAFLCLSPLPFLLTIIIPMALNFIFDFSHNLRPAIIRMSQIGVALSATLMLTGIFFARKVAPAGRRRFLLAALIASFPAVIILLTFSIMWSLP